MRMAQTIASFDTAHSGCIHDAQIDYYGRRLATASSDHSVRLWDVSEGGQFIAELRGHEGPVWAVSWAHPKFQALVASASFDGSLIVWRERQQGVWEQVHKDANFQGVSVNCVSFGPWEYGCILAAGASDGSVAILSYQTASSQWTREEIPMAHAGGVNGVSWAPSTSPATLGSSSEGNVSLAERKLVTCGNDSRVRVWQWTPSTGWRMAEEFPAMHGDWVRDVAWRPNVGIPSHTVASAGEDKTVVIYSQEMDGKVWKSVACIRLNAPVWKLSWSLTGSLLAAACADNSVHLFKENTAGEPLWISVHEPTLNNPNSL